MIKKKECVAMLLAGGQGSRLHVLTAKTAKPAVSFGGKYRIIDFPLSNCVNSGFDTVGVLTQYEPLFLNEYIGNGLPWDLDRSFGGVKILPPYQGNTRADWYRGTANAIYQNMEFISRYDPEYVLVLSGDHIYKMDYSAMLDFHKEKNADCTIATIDVDISEASRFGILTTDADGKIVKFTEKPRNPDSTKASMGIYIFKCKKLFDYLIADENDESSSKDFGKNVIPAMLSAGEKMYAYGFSGYWKDVGTLESLHEANMDLLGKRPQFNINDERWRIFSRHEAVSPQFVGASARIENSVITEGCEILGTVKNSVIGAGVKISYGAYVKDSVIMANTLICDGATVNYSIIDSDCTVGAGACIGADRKKSASLTVIGGGCRIGAGKVINDGMMISNGEWGSEK